MQGKHRFFTAQSPLNGVITVKGSDARHIGYSLRMKINDRLTLCHGGYDYSCKITNITADEVICEVLEKTPIHSEPSVFLTIYQAYPKQDKLESIIQKTVELGASRIVPFISKRCVSRPDGKNFRQKHIRLQRICEEAAKQSGRGIIPEVSEIMSFDETLEDMKSSELRLICYENGGQRLSESVAANALSNAASIAVMIGAEGGFERVEYESAVSGGITPIWLGERILSCETCPVAVTAIIMNITGNI